MSIISDNPDITMTVIATLVRRLGGSVTIADHEVRPFTIASKSDSAGLHIIVSEYEDDHRTNNIGVQ